MTTRTTCMTALGLAIVLATPSFAGGTRYEDAQPPRERHVRAGDDLVEWLLGGHRYYDRQMSTTAVGPCAYHRVGPDGNAVNDINDHYCGK